jgi:hypothetical protein
VGLAGPTSMLVDPPISRLTSGQLSCILEPSPLPSYSFAPHSLIPRYETLIDKILTPIASFSFLYK